VGGIEGVSNLARDVQGFFERHRPLLDTLGERRPFHQFHYEVVGADVVERADIRMVQRGDGARFDFEAARELLRGDLDGHFAAKAGIACPPDLAHSALANAREQLIGPESRGRGRGHLVD
jgi:hypothetical protein